MAYLLGIDIGTSSVKAVLLNPDSGELIARAGQEYPVYRPTPQSAEQNPADWWQAAVHVVRQVTADYKDIAAIGLCGQMHGFVMLDKTGEVLHPAIIWADARSSAEVAQLTDSIGAGALIAQTGTLPAVGFMGPTLLWLKTHMPDLLAKVDRVLLPKDYLHYRLTGHLNTDPSDAASTGLFDVKRVVWATPIIEAVNLNPAIFPTVKPSHTLHALHTEAADALGLPAGVPVAVGCADQPAQALANGIIEPGIASVTVGSGGQVFTPLASVRTDGRLHVFNHAVPGMVYALGATLSAGLSYRWLRDVLGISQQADAYAQLSTEASKVPAGADGLLFLPYLSGERTPYMDAHARGAFIGLSSYHTRGHLARAVMEGVAYSMRQALEITLALGGQIDRLIGSGGGVESQVWRSILTDVIGVPIEKSLQAEQTGIGAAVLAGVGTGIFASFAEAGGQIARFDEASHPNAEHHTLYNERYTQYTHLYPTLKADFHRLAGAV